MNFPERIWGNITPHINTGELRDADRIRRLLSSPDVHVAYLLGDDHYWIDYALSQPNIDLVVVRKFNPFNIPNAHEKDADGTIHQTHSPQDCYNYLISKHRKYQGNPKVRWIIGWNEPTHHPTDPKRSLKQLSNWMAQVGELFAKNRFGVAIGAIAAAKTNSLTGKPENLEAWNPVLDILAKYPDWIHMDIHEYEYAFLPINYLKNVDTAFPFSFFDKRITNPDNWGRIPYEGNAIYSNWKLGNFAAIMEYNEKVLGHPPFKWGRGEWGFDTMTESWWWNNPIGNNEPIERRWQREFGITAKGVHTLRRYYAYLHGKPEAEWNMALHNQFIIRQAAWFKLNSGKNCLYNTWYAWNTNPYWRTEDISHPDYTAFIEWIQSGQKLSVPYPHQPVKPPPEVDPDPTVPIPDVDEWATSLPHTLPSWKKVFIEPKAGSPKNIRELPTTDSPVVSIFNTVLVGYINPENAYYNDGYTWLPVYFEDYPDSEFSWVALDVIETLPYNTIDLTPKEWEWVEAYREKDTKKILTLMLEVI